MQQPQHLLLQQIARRRRQSVFDAGVIVGRKEARLEREADKFQQELRQELCRISIEQLRRAATVAAELAAREAERQRALGDFAAGRDWPPWEGSPKIRRSD